MTDNNDRETPVPDPTDPEESIGTDIPPPWERGTGRKLDGTIQPMDSQTMPPSELGKTQELREPTFGDVLDVFERFQTKVLQSLHDERKETVDAVREVGDELYEKYERLANDLLDVRAGLRLVRKRTHTHSSHIQKLELQVTELAQRLDALDKRGVPKIDPLQLDVESGVDDPDEHQE